MPFLLRLFACTLLLAGPLAAVTREAGWTKLKLGMSAAEVAATVGSPVLQSKNGGYEMWTYEGGAEVLFHGTGAVLGWTAPATAGLARCSKDVWSEGPVADFQLPPAASLPPPAPRKSASPAAAPTSAS